MIENIIQIKSGITRTADASAKKIIFVKRLYSESCYMYLRKCKCLSSIIDDSVITCDETVKEKKQLQQFLMKKI